MQALQDQGILVAVFDQLDDVSDMMRCATVSKAWRQASNHARPSRLCMSWVEAQVSQQTEGQDTPPSAALSAVQTWLQHKHAQGVFQRVQELSISIKPSLTQRVSLRELVLCESPLCNFSLHRFWRNFYIVQRVGQSSPAILKAQTNPWRVLSSFCQRLCGTWNCA